MNHSRPLESRGRKAGRVSSTTPSPIYKKGKAVSESPVVAGDSTAAYLEGMLDVRPLLVHGMEEGYELHAA